MAVNVSALQFSHPDFVKNVDKALLKTGANPHLLKLELTESMLLNDIDDVIVKMFEIKALGVTFALDDFGTGYSSLSYLKRLPLDQLKIDQSFVRDLMTDPNDAVIARTIVALGHSLGIKVMAEGVETLEFLGQVLAVLHVDGVPLLLDEGAELGEPGFCLLAGHTGILPAGGAGVRRGLTPGAGGVAYGQRGTNQ